jgi:hypothetical protein
MINLLLQDMIEIEITQHHKKQRISGYNIFQKNFFATTAMNNTGICLLLFKFFNKIF